jgi:hypothetical protein
MKISTKKLFPALRGQELIILGVFLTVLIYAGLALHVPGQDNVGSIALVNDFVAILAFAGIVYLAAVTLVVRQHRHISLTVILLIAAAMRIGPLLAPPFLSSDVFRYVWDGRVQVAGINPYRYIPADPALASLRDDKIYPWINRRDYAPTIYPPMAQAIFQAVARISNTVFAIKLVMVLAECVGLAAMLRLLDRAGLPRARLLIYAWNPLAVWTFAGNGHVDALSISFIGLAMLAAGTRRDSLAGLALGGAILVKFLPAAIFPALWRTRFAWRLPLSCAALIILLYAAYSSAGSHVLGFLASYAAEEGLAEGHGFWLLNGLATWTGLPSFVEPTYVVVALLALAATALRIVTQPPNDNIELLGRNTAILAAGLIFAISPHYPWYFVWLALPACLCPLPSVVYLSVAPLLLYIDPTHEHFFWPALIYVPVIILAIRDLRIAAIGRTPHVRHV